MSTAQNPVTLIKRSLLSLMCFVTYAGLAQAAATDHLSARKPIAAPQGAADLCTRHPWACAQTGGKPYSVTEMLRIARRVNRDVNAHTRSLSDRRQYGQEERWALPTARGGDCEDFALAKKKRLIEAGLKPKTLLIATVLDRRKAPHAVLVMRTPKGDFVLDNLRPSILRWQATGYSFLSMQNPDAPAHWQAILAGGVFEKGGS